MKQRHEEIRKKYGEPSDYFELNWQDDARLSVHFLDAFTFICHLTPMCFASINTVIFMIGCIFQSRFEWPKA